MLHADTNHTHICICVILMETLCGEMRDVSVNRGEQADVELNAEIFFNNSILLFLSNNRIGEKETSESCR